MNKVKLKLIQLATTVMLDEPLTTNERYMLNLIHGIVDAMLEE